LFKVKEQKSRQRGPLLEKTPYNNLECVKGFLQKYYNLIPFLLRVNTLKEPILVNYSN